MEKKLKDKMEKINDSKFNRLEKMAALKASNFNKEVLDRLSICYKTLTKWKKQMEFIKKINEVKIDRALREMLFTSKEQVQCFEFLIKDLNYFSTYEEVNKIVPISRYYFKIVHKYIKDELTKLN